MSKPCFVLSGFADEAVIYRNFAHPEQQLSIFSALGLTHYTPRTVNFSKRPGENKNVIYLGEDALEDLKYLQDQFGMNPSSLGTPIGKSALLENKPSRAKYKPQAEVLADLEGAFRAGEVLGTRLLRGFSFYPPDGEDSESYYNQALDLLDIINARCKNHGFLYGIEVEAGLIGRDGKSVSRLVKDLNRNSSPGNNVVGIFDAANVHVQGLNAWDEYLAMADEIGWMHIKDYEVPCEKAITLDEEGLSHFCPVDVGLARHGTILLDLEGRLDSVYEKLGPFGADGVPLDLEPHVNPEKGGGQFGGHSGPDGMGIALRALTKLLDRTGIQYKLRDYDSIKQKKN